MDYTLAMIGITLLENAWLMYPFHMVPAFQGLFWYLMWFEISSVNALAYLGFLTHISLYYDMDQFSSGALLLFTHVEVILSLSMASLTTF
jgi:hypothetical protein